MTLLPIFFTNLFRRLSRNNLSVYQNNKKLIRTPPSTSNADIFVLLLSDTSGDILHILDGHLWIFSLYYVRNCRLLTLHTWQMSCTCGVCSLLGDVEDVTKPYFLSVVWKRVGVPVYLVLTGFSGTRWNKFLIYKLSTNYCCSASVK